MGRQISLPVQGAPPDHATVDGKKIVEKVRKILCGEDTEHELDEGRAMGTAAGKGGAGDYERNGGTEEVDV